MSSTPETGDQPADRSTSVVVGSALDLMIRVVAGRIEFASPAAERLHGSRAGMAARDHLEALIDPEHLTPFRNAMERLWRRTSNEERLDVRMRGVDGVWRWFDTLVTRAVGDEAGLVTIQRDISERKDEEQRLADAAWLFSSVFERASVGLALLAARPDGTAEFVRTNSRLAGSLGRTAEALIGTPLTAVVHPDDVDAVMASHERLVSNHTTDERLHVRVLSSNGGFALHATHRTLLTGVGEGARFVLLQSDEVAEDNDALTALSYLARTDTLTELPNRRTIEDALRALLADPGARASSAVLFLDLDGFKQVNDGLGHAAGDEVLKLVAQHLLRSVRPHDIVGRLGGDEFLIIARRIEPDQADRLSTRLSNTMFRYADRFDVRASIGVALLQDDDDVASVLNRADQAMYRSKRR